MTTTKSLFLSALFVLFGFIYSPADDRNAETQLYGITTRGSSFVYVFDRSLSMQGAALASAKRELLSSLGQLKSVQQFQIIFYNEKPKIMPPGPLLFADENGRRQAECAQLSHWRVLLPLDWPRRWADAWAT